MSDEEKKEVQVHSCGSLLCLKDGKEHQWDGPAIETESSYVSTCSKCGMDSMTWCMFNGP